MNIFTQFVAEGSDGIVTLFNDEQLLNIFTQFVTEGSDGSLTSMSETHDSNRDSTLFNDGKFKCDKSAYFNERHL